MVNYDDAVLIFLCYLLLDERHPTILRTYDTVQQTFVVSAIQLTNRL